LKFCLCPQHRVSIFFLRGELVTGSPCKDPDTGEDITLLDVTPTRTGLDVVLCRREGLVEEASRTSWSA
jgi:hypothetical protein